MKKIVVTGAAGFIGSNLVKHLLAEGYSVLSIDDLSAGTLENLPAGTEFKKIDVCHPSLATLLEGADMIFHMAAKNCLPDCAANPMETARVNVLGTANVLEAAVKCGVSHVVYSDTSAEYEGIHEFPSRVENVRPLSVYACAKRGGALMCDAFANLHPIKISTVRYFNVYGPAQDWRRVVPPVMSAFTIRLLSGIKPVIYGNGEKSRDFIHVDDVNDFHMKLVREKELWGGTYNLGSGTTHTILEVFEKIRQQIGCDIQPEFKPDLPAEAFQTLADISETEKTGWRPRVTIDQGIKGFIDYTRQRLASEVK